MSDQEMKVCEKCGEIYMIRGGMFSDIPCLCHRPVQPDTSKLPKVQADWKWRHDNRVKDIESYVAQLQSLQNRLEAAEMVIVWSRSLVAGVIERKSIQYDIGGLMMALKEYDALKKDE